MSQAGSARTAHVDSERVTVATHRDERKLELTILSRAYRGEDDFRRVRELLVESLAIFGEIHNWWLDRWEVFRFAGHSEDELSGVRPWEADVRLWEVVGDYANPAKLVGVVNPEDGGDSFM